MHYTAFADLIHGRHWCIGTAGCILVVQLHPIHTAVLGTVLECNSFAQQGAFAWSPHARPARAQWSTGGGAWILLFAQQACSCAQWALQFAQAGCRDVVVCFNKPARVCSENCCSHRQLCVAGAVGLMKCSCSCSTCCIIKPIVTRSTLKTGWRNRYSISCVQSAADQDPALQLCTQRANSLGYKSVSIASGLLGLQHLHCSDWEQNLSNSWLLHRQTRRPMHTQHTHTHTLSLSHTHTHTYCQESEQVPTTRAAASLDFLCKHNTNKQTHTHTPPVWASPDYSISSQSSTLTHTHARTQPANNLSKSRLLELQSVCTRTHPAWKQSEQSREFNTLSPMLRKLRHSSLVMLIAKLSAEDFNVCHMQILHTVCFDVSLSAWLLLGSGPEQVQSFQASEEEKKMIVW